MDKQMIEENGKELYNDLSSIMSEEYEKRMLITPSYCANKMLEKNYRKIPENAVVLTRDEYNELCCSIGVSREEVDRVVDMVEKDTRKETAEKFAEMVKAKARHTYVNIDDNPRKDSFVLLSDIDEICKRIIKENE